MSYGSDYHYLPVTSVESGELHEAAPDVACYTVQIVNIGLIGAPGHSDWVLVDAGMPKSADRIIEAAEARFGKGSRPQAIILTHGHFDHVGAIIELIEYWQDVPVYAHERELPYLTGQQSYPEQDPTVDSGLVAKMSPLFPIRPIQLGGHVKALPTDGSIPNLPDWKWVHTPGHTPGHISLFRESDRFLIAGDAFVTVKQESLYKVFTQEQEINGPPKYLTTDWVLARDSVRRLEALKPSAAITGHGLPMKGPLLADQLFILANEFDRIAIPEHGKYVH
ncbi:MBL fold metallo-hydrolase [Paenibacillus nanensis]|uniref:MBL fold metallo-hydrolase n=1 Tax=Paenibacillus nanensis TaxID=393251 RepID=A0A3A1USX3_9BACL|nr:MBL fold metallo-hydrolase [Paenibacillus nanensis]RIX50896.1 MBL fold metallo-hydrolase [Paenibacillus nanensis]